MELLISAGFYLLRPSARPVWASESLLPEQIISVSDCLCPQFPGSYAIEWTGNSEEQRVEAFNAVGLPPAQRSAATEWATKNFQQSFGWPGVFYSPQKAQAARAHFFAGSSDLQVIGLGLPLEFLEEFVAYAAPPPLEAGFAAQGESGWLEVAKHRQALPEGQFLGFELLDVEFGMVAHSWLCNHLEAHFAKAQGLRPNELGLIGDLHSAKLCCDVLKNEEVGAEPGLWLPWGLVRYG